VGRRGRLPAASCSAQHLWWDKEGEKDAATCLYLALVSDRALRATVVVGRSDLGMPDWRGDVAGRSMSEPEIADVVAWLVAQRAAFPGAPEGPPPGEEKRDG